MAAEAGRVWTISPIDGRVLVERPHASERELLALLGAARGAQRAWRRRPLAERCALISAAVDAFVAHGPAIAEEITLTFAFAEETAQPAATVAPATAVGIEVNAEPVKEARKAAVNA